VGDNLRIEKNMKVLVVTLLVLVSVSLVGYQPQASARAVHAVNLVGKWRVKFHLSGVENNLLFNSQPKGLGSFLLLDSKSDDKFEAVARPAVWGETTNERVSFCGHLTLQLGTCCREMGTLIFKGRFSSNNSITGKLIFVTSVEEEESPYRFRSEVGAFEATRVLE